MINMELQSYREFSAPYTGRRMECFMKKVSIGYQQYDELITNNLFYIDKTRFIEEWWESGDKVTLIARPRRFGKTLTMSMIEQFFPLNIKNGKKSISTGFRLIRKTMRSL